MKYANKQAVTCRQHVYILGRRIKSNVWLCRCSKCGKEKLRTVGPKEKVAHDANHDTN